MGQYRGWTNDIVTTASNKVRFHSNNLPVQYVTEVDFHLFRANRWAYSVLLWSKGRCSSPVRLERHFRRHLRPRQVCAGELSKSVWSWKGMWEEKVILKTCTPRNSCLAKLVLPSRAKDLKISLDLSEMKISNRAEPIPGWALSLEYKFVF